jgi:hypothetical protein
VETDKVTDQLGLTESLSKDTENPLPRRTGLECRCVSVLSVGASALPDLQ